MENLQIPPEIQKRLLELRKKTFKMLIVEDNELVRKTLGWSFEMVFPHATISFLEKEDWGNIDSIIDSGEFEVFSFDGDLTGWLHPIYRDFGMGPIKRVKEKKQETFVFATSNSPLNNHKGTQNGADFAITKDNITILAAILDKE